MPHPRQSNLAEESYKIFIPEEYLVDFEVNHIENKPVEWIIELVEKGTTKHYSNEYDLHIPGMKTTREFRDFLKEIGG